MLDPYERDPRTGNRILDVTPGAGWRRLLRRLGFIAFLLVVVPVAWFFGALAVLILLGAGLLAVAGLVARAAWLNWRHGGEHPRGPPRGPFGPQ